MSGFKGLTKGGWHPQGKDGKKESWRGDFKGVDQVAGWMGKKQNPADEARDHQSAPLSTLKDPASFGPPPKHINYHGAAAVPNATTPDRRGLGAPLTQDELDAKKRLEEAAAAQARAEEEANKPPPGPYKVNTTGLSTSNLPKPPVRRLDQESSSPTISSQPKSKPSLPPRLPPRQNSHPDAYAPVPPPSYTESTQAAAPEQGQLNQGALNRLGQAGVSVSGFNIGRTTSPPVPPRQSTSPGLSASSPIGGSRGPQLGELQSRFAKMSTGSSSKKEPSVGTSFADKQAALKTAGDLRTDPSKVSMSDMRSAASTANNFRERHGDQVSAGWQKASGINQKYGVADRVNSYASGAGSVSSPPQSPVKGTLGKKPPPPPPPKKKDILQSPNDAPPIPLGSKPKPPG